MGAQSNFMTERLAQQLGLSRQRMLSSLSGVGAMALTANSMVTATVRSRVSRFSAVLDFVVLQRVTADVPALTVNVDRWNIPSGVRLADPTFFKSERVDLLIGAELFADLLEKGHIKVAPHLPSLLKTKFGWIVSGPMRDSIEYSNNSVLCHCVQEENLIDLMRHFAALEDIPQERETSEEGLSCERFYCDTTIQNEEGRYVVQLPKVREYEKQLGDSKETALRRFLSIERRLKKDEAMKKEYVEFMEEYEQLGHMTKVASYNNVELEVGKDYYLPHHAVWKRESTTTKCRVVFDASCKSSSGRSLNDILLTGPTIQEDIIPILLRFRMKKVALVADVAKMYRQVLVAKEDRKLQRILWRKESEEPISVYELNTVTYGTACAPFLAIRTLLRVFEDYGRHYPEALKSKDDFYVDDLVSGADSIEEAKQIAKQLDELMNKAEFSLRKWASNYPETLEGIPQQRQCESVAVEQASKSSISLLGLLWTPRSDSMQLNIKGIEQQTSYSGKQILSCIARMYDPLGIIDPVKMKAKMFMQRVWSYKESRGSGRNWDNPLPDELQVEWKNFYAELKHLSDVSVPRTVIDRAEDNYQIHIFCDASEKGYGACCYIRSRNSHSGEIVVRLFISKSKVAPLSKKLTIARLELCGALLASNLYQLVQRAVAKEVTCYMWTDSMTAWYWINSPSDRWKPFVANRTRRIQAKTQNCIWKHIPGVDNPADLVSRGTDAKALIDARQWWAGPSWLPLDEDMWPISPNQKPITTDEERTSVLLVSSPVEESFSDRLFERCSTYISLRKGVGYWLRYLNILRARRKGVKPPGHTSSGLSTEELVETDKFLYRLAQKDQFSEEFKAMLAKKCVPRTSPLRFLNPFIDDQGLMRVNGRLANSQLDSDMKQPILIPKNHRLTSLLVQHYHLRLLHAGPQLMISTIRQSLWIIGVRSVARSVYHKCMRCFKVTPKHINQPMGNLPPSRVTEARAFAVSGVDYAGPVYVKERHRRAAPTKAFVAVFVCFVTHAVHLELVSDLSTAAFISALRRFVARRGLVSELYSDNGTNFKGASNELHQLYQLLQSTHHREAVTAWSADKGFKWKFIPPRAPHFGGLWESAVRSMKHHLQRVLGTASTSFEDLVTLLAEIELCLNSRPITPLSHDPSDLQALTPGHFLTGYHLQVIPDIALKDIPENRLNHWRVVQKRLQHFWARWSTEYLQQLHARSKWNCEATEIKPGMVLCIIRVFQTPDFLDENVSLS
ncbi:uncharacterized protein LOC125766030 [Anopheles funestus]|uniref:uncharacterized protein LOC125766030 n=1 Tax=Anopheles funestus TaxID=62324 RepID=UPI0020C6FAC2|nr:uncharacterized protein LOC125766030 [Anopheles funestus]